MVFLTAVTILLVSYSTAYAEGTAPVRQGATLQLPTATQTQAGSSTTTPTRTPTAAPVFAQTTGDPTTNLRSLPSIGDEFVIAAVPPGTSLPIIGRWLGYDWYLVAWEDSDTGEAWVYKPLVFVQGDITTVPAVEPPPPPTQNPTEVAALATATILVQTPGAVEAATQTAVFAPTIVPTHMVSEDGNLGLLPTFTPAPPFFQLEEIPAPDTSNLESGGIPPAVLIISFAVMGVLALVLSVIRRLF